MAKVSKRRWQWRPIQVDRLPMDPIDDVPPVALRAVFMRTLLGGQELVVSAAGDTLPEAIRNLREEVRSVRRNKAHKLEHFPEYGPEDAWQDAE